MKKKTVKEKIYELSAMYNTYGLDSEFAKMAEKTLFDGNMTHIHKARILSAQSRYVM